MRLIFFSLLLIVLSYFVWNHWGVPWYVSIDNHSGEVVSSGAPKSLVLLAEQAPQTPSPDIGVVSSAQVSLQPQPARSESQAAGSSRQLVDPTAVPANPVLKNTALKDDETAVANTSVANEVEPVVLVCREFGPFYDQDEADRFKQVIGVDGEILERDVKKASAKWLVLASPAETPDQVKGLSMFLEQQGLFMSRTGVKNESAIGPFVSEKVALSYQSRLQEIGVTTNLRSADESKKEFWLRSEFGMDRLPMVSAVFNGYLNGGNQQGVTQLVCN